MRYRVLLLAVLLLLATPATAEDAGPAELALEPDHLDIDLLYDGVTVHARASFPAGYQVAIVCSGSPSTVELKKKGKVLHVLWMNVGDVTYENVPGLYAARTSAPLEELAGREALAAAGVGEWGFRSAILPGDAPAEQGGDLFDDFIDLRRRDGLYDIAEGALEIQSSGEVWKTSGAFGFPSNVTVGEYRFALVGFREGRARCLATRTFPIEKRGAVAAISSLARDHGLAYGIIAVVIALGAGLVTGVVFRGRKKGAH